LGKREKGVKVVVKEITKRGRIIPGKVSLRVVRKAMRASFSFWIGAGGESDEYPFSGQCWVLGTGYRH